MNKQIYDVVGIGFGPANIALAVALEERAVPGNFLFLERCPSAEWQSEMLLSGSDIQHHPVRDLVSLRNPRSRYSFINFLHENNLLLDHLNLGLEFPLRREYMKYIFWVASFFSNWVRYSQNVTSISTEYIDSVSYYKVVTSDQNIYLAKSLILATGRTPHIPQQFEPYLGEQVFHLNNYLSKIKNLGKNKKLQHGCVIGNSQSAIEIVLDLIERYPNMTVSNLMRKNGYRLKDTSQFSERIYFPEFVDYYYSCDEESKRSLNQYLHYTNYSAADGDVITALNTKIYEEKLESKNRINLYINREILQVKQIDGQYELDLFEIHMKQKSQLKDIDFIVLATGFKDMGLTAENKEPFPYLLTNVANHFKMNKKLGLHVNRDYSLAPVDVESHLPPIYLNGLCESTHGYGDAGSFSLLSIRVQDITSSLLKSLSLEHIAL